MTITAIQQSHTDKTAALVQIQARITALGTPTSDNQRQLLKQTQEEFVRGCMDASKVHASAVISTIGAGVFSAAWLAKYHPEIAKLNTQITKGVTGGDVGAQLIAAQIQAVDDAMAQGIVSAANIISSCTWNT